MDKPEFVVPLALPFADGIEIAPANIQQIARLLQLAGPVVDELVALPADVLARFQAGAPSETDLMRALLLVQDHGDLAIDLVAIASGLEHRAVATMLPDRFGYLFALVVQVNADFFARSAPAFAAVGRLLAGVRRPGQAPKASQPAAGARRSTS